MSQSRSYKDILQGLGGTISWPIAAITSCNLTLERIVGIPSVGGTLAESMPINMWRVVTFAYLKGTFSNFYSNLGTAIDIMIDGVKTLYSCDNSKDWLKVCTAKNTGHVIGALTGTVLGVYLVSIGASPSAYSLMGDAQQSLPLGILQANEVFYLSGAGSNLMSHFFEGTKNEIENGKHCIGFLSSVKSTLFNKRQIPVVEIEPSITRNESDERASIKAQV